MSEGKYNLVFQKDPWVYAGYNTESDNYIIDDSLFVGEINFIRLDTINKIYSGTFWFNAVNENDSTDVIHITEGRFDVRD